MGKRAAFLLATLVMIIGAFSVRAETPAESAAVSFADLPAQYREELEDTAESVAFYRGSRPMLTLLVFSDLHEDPFSAEPKALEDMLACMKELIGEILPDAIFNLGDLIYGERYPLGQAVPQIAEITAKFRGLGVPYYNLLGNHDDLSEPDPPVPGAQPEAEPLTTEDLYRTLLSGNPGAVFNALRRTDFYVDFGDVRVVCLSAAGAAYQPETAEWLRRQALDTDQAVLVLSHCPTRPEWGYFMDVTGGEMIEDALREFSGRGGTVLAHIHGHDHGDMLEQAEDLPYTGVAVGCARISQPRQGTAGIVYQPRNPGDETKLLFEVVLVDPQAERVRMIRFGAGENRTVTAGE